MRTFSILILAVFIAVFAWLQQYTAPLYDGEVYVIEDSYSDITLEKARKMDWSREAPSPVNFGFTASAFWFYLPLPDYVLTSPLAHMLEIDFPSIDELDVYLLDSSGAVVEQFHTGTDFPFASRPVWDDDWVFPLTPAQRPAAVLMRAATSNSLQMPIRIYEQVEFYRQDTSNLLFWGGFYGVVLIMALYGFLNGMVISDRLYLYYGAYVVASTLTVASLNGHGFAYLWPELPEVNAIALSVFPCLLICFGTAFAMEFLDMVRLRFRMRFIGYGFMLVALLTAACAIVLKRDLSFWAAVETVAFSVALLVFGALAVRRQHYLGWYFLIGWSVFLFGAGMFALNVLGVLPFNVITVHSKEIGSVFEIIMLALGMSAIYHHEKEERYRIDGAIDLMKQRLQQRASFISNKSGLMKIPQLEHHLQDIRALDRRIHQEMGRMLVIAVTVIDRSTRRPDHIAQSDCLRALFNSRVTVFPFKTLREGLSGEVTLLLFPLHNKFEAEAILERVEQWSHSLGEQYDLHFGYAISHLTEKYDVDYIEESLHYLEEAILQQSMSYSIDDTLTFAGRHS
ncbi:MAG: hypothetical protein HPY82_12370 [Gammaproteobacteria bacterium]|nr:hypothetical protein [Gammaproteobacteria bacterium]